MDIFVAPFFKKHRQHPGRVFCSSTPVVSLAADLATRPRVPGGNASLGQAGKRLHCGGISPRLTARGCHTINSTNTTLVNSRPDPQQLQGKQPGPRVGGIHSWRNANLSNGAAGLISIEVTGFQTPATGGLIPKCPGSGRRDCGNPHGISCDWLRLIKPRA